MNILVTGATSGIGKQLARDYLAAGHRVYCCGRDAEALASLSSEFGDLVQALIFDVTDREACIEQIQSTDELDLAILNAGTCEYVNARKFDAALFGRVLQTNVQGVANCLEALIPRLRKGATLGLMGSSSSFLPLPRAEAYGASKAAIEYLSKTLAISLRPLDIHVSYIAPGFVETPLTDANDFPMPMQVDVEFASRKIRSGLASQKRIIHFPRLFTGFLRVLASLPLGLQSRLIARAVSR